MIKTLNEQDILKFKDLSEEEKTRRGILGTLFGPIASVVKCTRNGRKYPDDVWEKVFEDKIVKEMLASGGIPGELDHPQDRSETCSEKIAIMMPEAPKKDNKGHLVARFDIIDTPMGRIAAALARYGFKFGISSRGTGDTFTDYDGNESVDPDTYDFQAFDLVLLPACEDARLKLAESFDTKKVRLSKALNEALDKASESDRKIMEEALENLDIDYNSEKSSNIDEDSKPVAAEDVGAQMLNELQESLRIQTELESQVKSLQEQLSVCYTKENKYSEAMRDFKHKLDSSKSRIGELTEKINSLSQQIQDKDATISEKDGKIESLQESIRSMKMKSKSLTEGLSTSDKQIKNLEAEIRSLNESHTKKIADLSRKSKQLEENLKDQMRDANIKNSQLTAQNERAKDLVEKYKRIAKAAVDKYIDSQSQRFGIDANSVKAQLKENYSFSDIDRVCDNLRQYKLDLNTLPFNINGNNKKQIKMALTESKVRKNDSFSDMGIDDDVDETLLSIIG